MASSGTIIVNIYTSDARIPVEGASVLFQSLSPASPLLGFRLTDSSGRTAPLTVLTTDLSQSQAPDPSGLPFTQLRIIAEHPEFERTILEGVQVFPGITTLQSIQLLPLSRTDPEKDQQQDFVLPPQTL